MTQSSRNIQYQNPEKNIFAEFWKSYQNFLLFPGIRNLVEKKELNSELLWRSH